jgi:RHS repeat-associated protein
VRSQTETPKRYRYTAKECDEENGLYYNGMRYYAAWLGRWIACDPVGTVDGTSLFVYVGDNPTNRTDPTGRQWTPWQERMRMQQLAEAVRPVGEAVEGAVDWTGQVTTGVGRAGLDFTIGTFKLVTGLLGASWGEETVSETVEGVRNLPTTVKETVDNWDQLSAEEKAYRLTTGALLVRGAYKFAKGMTSGRPGGEPVTERPPTVEEGASPSRPPTPRAEAKPAETSAKPAETSAPTPRQGLEETGPARFRVAIIDRLHTTLARQILRLGEGIRNRDIPYLRNLGLRSATIRQLLQGRGKGFAAAYGRALERALTRAIQSDPELGKYFEHIGSRAGVAVRPPGRPDFRGRPGTEFEGWLVDLTTTAGREAHHGRYYGEKMLVLPYDRPGSR